MSSLSKSQSTSIEDIAAINKPSRDQKLRQSLPTKLREPSEFTLRHTQSQELGVRRKKKTNLPPVIPEVETLEFVESVNENVRKDRKRSRHNSQGHDNKSFQGDNTPQNLSRSSSINITNELPALRTPQNPSITNSVIHEQYCWCCRPDRTHCERVSFAVIGVLIFIIIILVIIVAVIAEQKNTSPKEAIGLLFKGGR